GYLQNGYWVCCLEAKSVFFPNAIVYTLGCGNPKAMIRRIFIPYVAVALLLNSTFHFAAGRSQVADAVMNGEKAALRTLLQRKADVNATQVDGATALHWSVYRDDLESLDLVIAAGATIDVKTREGITPLNLAC